MTEKLILAFDTSRSAIRHLDRIHPALKDAGYTLKFYHTDSWEPASTRLSLTSSTGIETTDVGGNVGYKLLELVRAASPEAVVLLTSHTFTERAVNRFCQHIGIPTLWLNHGLTEVQDMEATDRIGVKPVARAMRLIPRLHRLLFKVLPTYFAAVWATNGIPSTLSRTISDIFVMAFGWNIRKFAADCRCSASAVYTDADIEHSVKRYGYRPENTYVVGNPDLFDFGVEEDYIASLAGRTKPNSNEIVYIDTRLVHHGYAYDSNEAFIDHLKALRAAAERQGYSVVLKLHPGHASTDVPQCLRDVGFELLGAENFCKRLLRAAAAIVEPSSADLIPALLGLPVLAAKFGSLSAVKYGPIVNLYPRAVELTDLDEIDSSIKQLWLHSDPEKLRHWIRANAGPLPADQFSQRVVKVLRAEIAKRESEKMRGHPVTAS